MPEKWDTEAQLASKDMRDQGWVWCHGQAATWTEASDKKSFVADLALSRCFVEKKNRPKEMSCSICVPGADHHPVHWLPGPDLLLLLRLPGREGCRGRGGQDGLLQLRWCAVVGRGEAATQKQALHWWVLLILIRSLDVSGISQHSSHTWQATSHVQEKGVLSL